MVKLTACSLMKRLIFASFTSSVAPHHSSIVDVVHEDPDADPEDHFGEEYNQSIQNSVNNESKIWGSSVPQSQGSQSMQNSTENDSNMWGSSIPGTSQKPTTRSYQRPTHADLSEEVDFDSDWSPSNDDSDTCADSEQSSIQVEEVLGLIDDLSRNCSIKMG